MLTIPFSHTYKKMGLVTPGCKHWLLNYCIKWELSDDFINYDTAYYPKGLRIERAIKYFKLGPAPYLILFIKSQVNPWDYHYWTTVRCPWKRTRIGCETCRLNDGYYCGDVTPEQEFRCWIPRIPKKYRQARGKEIRIEIKEK